MTPLRGPGAPCSHCQDPIPSEKRSTAEFCGDRCRKAARRADLKPAKGEKPAPVSKAKDKRKHVVSYPGEHCSEDRASRLHAQARRSLLETGAPSVRALVETWYRSNGRVAAVVELPPRDTSCVELPTPDRQQVAA